ncbi:uncharacterized protein LOC117505315 [Thalassophryne amazonica]|uniref:uncharacterized protein LOC117505315 n=1 Tax=Thalassophryne amazonica TaxID=390379 RepID=UPI0014711F79|nr:uncharacterized protein LOC117505315 [Thalassophryne amazonica]
MPPDPVEPCIPRVLSAKCTPQEEAGPLTFPVLPAGEGTSVVVSLTGAEALSSPTLLAESPGEVMQPDCLTKSTDPEPTETLKPLQLTEARPCQQSSTACNSFQSSAALMPANLIPPCPPPELAVIHSSPSTPLLPAPRMQQEPSTASTTSQNPAACVSAVRPLSDSSEHLLSHEAVTELQDKVTPLEPSACHTPHETSLMYSYPKSSATFLRLPTACTTIEGTDISMTSTLHLNQSSTPPSRVLLGITIYRTAIVVQHTETQ